MVEDFEVVFEPDVQGPFSAELTALLEEESAGGPADGGTNTAAGNESGGDARVVVETPKNLVIKHNE